MSNRGRIVMTRTTPIILAWPELARVPPIVLAWPESARIPVAGELIITKAGEFLVDSVQWEQRGTAWDVQLRVTEQR